MKPVESVWRSNRGPESSQILGVHCFPEGLRGDLGPLGNSNQALVLLGSMQYLAGIPNAWRYSDMNIAPDCVATERLDHLGIIAGILQEMSLRDRVNETLGEKAYVTQRVTVGDCVCAMVLNGLGFTNRALYLVHSFFQGKPIERLLGHGLTSDDFNDDTLGKALDIIFAHCPTQLFAEVAFRIGIDLNLLDSFARLDSSSFALEGKYEGFGGESDDMPEVISVVHGHSKDHRPDLKQFMLNLMVSGACGFPMWAEALSGNSSDKKTFHETIARVREFQKQFADVPEFLWIADSALYSKEHLLQSHLGYDWLTRAPENILAVKQLVEMPDSAFAWKEIGGGYKIVALCSWFGGIPQRWLLVFSEEANKRELRTYERNLTKEKEALEMKLWHLGNDKFACQADAAKRLQEIMAKHPRFTASFTVEEKPRYAGKGRPKRGAEPIGQDVLIKAVICENHAVTDRQRATKGRFVLATNRLDSQNLADEDMLREYKGLAKVERGFRFLKDPRFLVSQVFLKKPSRIAALLAVMAFTLMTYNYGEHVLRLRLNQKKEMLPNQLRQDTATPTLRWVFQLMDGIAVVHITMEGLHQTIIPTLSPTQAKIVEVFGGSVAALYRQRTES